MPDGDDLLILHWNPALGHGRMIPASIVDKLLQSIGYSLDYESTDGHARANLRQLAASPHFPGMYVRKPANAA